MVLYSERVRMQELAALEAVGEDVWVTELPPRALSQIQAVWEQLPSVNDPWLTPAVVDKEVERQIKLQLYRAGLYGPTNPQDFGRWDWDVSTDARFDVLEALYIVLHSQKMDAKQFEADLNEVLNSHRIAYKMINGEMLPYRGDPVFAATVEPAIRLLIDKRFDAAQTSYMNALREISAGEAADAITDAGTALESVLRKLGCEGANLSNLINNARKAGILDKHDSYARDAIQGFMEWAGAERNHKGDMHASDDRDANLDDAWLMVQVVGALILRLAADNPRGIVPDGDPLPF